MPKNERGKHPIKDNRGYGFTGSMPDPKSRIRKMSPTEAAYIASMLDGEGHITLQKVNKGRNMTPHIGVGSTTPLLIDVLKEYTGFSGISGRYKKRKGQIGKQPYTVWYIAARSDCKDLLRQVLPYLTLKHDHALYLRAALLAHEDGKPATDFEWACYWVLRDLNSRGKDKLRQKFYDDYEAARQQLL